MCTQETGASVRGEGKSSHHNHHDQTEERPKEAHLDHTVGVLVGKAAGDQLLDFAVERAGQKNVDKPCNAEDDEWCAVLQNSGLIDDV